MEVARLLLNAKADPNAESRNGFTPLHLAAQDGSVEMVRLLLDHKAKVNARAKVGFRVSRVGWPDYFEGARA